MTTKITPDNVKPFLDGIDAILFDCDGVLWKHKEVIPGVIETLEWLRKMGKQLYFVTNNATESRQSYLKKFQTLGIAAKKEEIYSSSYASAAYLKSQGFNKKVYIVGERGVADEMDEAGIAWRGVTEHNDPNESVTSIASAEFDSEVGAVVVGLDTHICYSKMSYALWLLQQPNVLFVATNTDNTYPSLNGRFLAGGGAMVAMLEYCSERTATVVGKPNTFLLDLVLEQHHLEPSRTLMVGDKLDTDILFGINGKLTTLLVLTGVTSEAELLSPKNTITPTYYADDLHTLLRSWS